jgi:hypothetical protein
LIFRRYANGVNPKIKVVKIGAILNSLKLSSDIVSVID